MTQQEYEQKKRECLGEFCKEHGFIETADVKGIFGYAFDRAYALGKQTETITQEEIEKAAKKYAAEVDKNVRDLYGIEEQPASLTFGECAAESFREGAKFALGREKDAEETKADNTIKARRKSDGEIIEVREWRGASDVIYSSPDMNQFYQASDLDFNVDLEDTVIHGWVARDCDGDVFLYQNEPDRNEIAWNGYMMHSLPIDSFPGLTWESDPLPVEIILKRKKNG